MTDVYKQLAERLDQLPHGYPATESGVELKILQKIFTPDDAEMALKMKYFPETVEAIADRLGEPVEEMRTTLDNMAIKGQIGSSTSKGKQMYMLAPFVVGIYEYQVYRLDKELVDLFEEYFPILSKSLGGYKPAIARTIPINTNLKQDFQIQPYENLTEMLENANSFRVTDCICRKERIIAGNSCDHSLEVCLGFSKEEGAYDYFSRGGRIISKGEAFKVIAQAEEEGLIHNVFYNVKEGHGAICNCCSCCCGVIRAAKEYGAAHTLAKSNYLALINSDECTACGVCADERCQMDAISEDGDVYRVVNDLCIGCGVCTITCPTDAISLIERPKEDQDNPPDDYVDWSMKRAANRGIKFAG
jgi:electron transport complex protein RnfB